MKPTTGASAEGPSDHCAELRAVVNGRCREAHEARAAHEAAVVRLRELRRDLVAAEHRRTEAVAAADPRLRSAEKAAARDRYQLARRSSSDDDVLREATAAWARSVDQINRAGRLAQRAARAAQANLTALERAVVAAEAAERQARMGAEGAEAGCLDARVDLAACEEAGTVEVAADAAAASGDPDAATDAHAVRIGDAEQGPPLVMESMVSGDRRALELAASEVAAHTGSTPAEAQLQLQELVGAIVSAAAEAGFLTFDPAHPFWAYLEFEEAHDVIAALARLGFQFEPSEGWHAGRAPAPSDLSMALAYAGLDARSMRDVPSAEDLRLLPRSIGVDARAFLVAQAPGLTVEQLVGALGRRAEPLELLWNEWGQVRPVLLADRHDLGSVPG